MCRCIWCYSLKRYAWGGFKFYVASEAEKPLVIIALFKMMVDYLLYAVLGNVICAFLWDTWLGNSYGPNGLDWEIICNKQIPSPKPPKGLL